jgi:hypothetical protein
MGPDIPSRSRHGNHWGTSATEHPNSLSVPHHQSPRGSWCRGPVPISPAPVSGCHGSRIPLVESGASVAVLLRVIDRA